MSLILAKAKLLRFSVVANERTMTPFIVFFNLTSLDCMCGIVCL